MKVENEYLILAMQKHIYDLKNQLKAKREEQLNAHATFLDLKNRADYIEKELRAVAEFLTKNAETGIDYLAEVGLSPIQKEETDANKIIELPIGWSAKEDSAIGVSYYDDKGNIRYQHPVDNDLARKEVWEIYNHK